MSYRDNVEAYKEAIRRLNDDEQFIDPDDFRAMRHLHEMRAAAESSMDMRSVQQFHSDIITAEALVCVIDRLDRVIELLEERA